MRSNWLYLLTRSPRAGAPVLICPALVPTARSAIVVSSVSPERCEMTAAKPGRARHLDGLERLGDAADLVDLDQDRVGRAFASMPRCSRSVLVTNRSSPTSCTRSPRRVGQLLPAVPIVFGQAVFDRDDRVLGAQLLVQVDQLAPESAWCLRVRGGTGRRLKNSVAATSSASAICSPGW